MIDCHAAHFDQCLVIRTAPEDDAPEDDAREIERRAGRRDDSQDGVSSLALRVLEAFSSTRLPVLLALLLAGVPG